MRRSFQQTLWNWASEHPLKPLIIWGSKGVGKSYEVEKFGQYHFDNTVVLDFKRQPDLIECFDPWYDYEDHILPENAILEEIEKACQQRIVPGDTLLVLDEMPNCPEMEKGLRIFSASRSDIHIIVTRSSMEDISQSFPHGEYAYAYLRPMTFLEYMRAAAPQWRERLIKFSRESPPTSAEHAELMQWVKRYFFVGGMPAAVLASLGEDSSAEVSRVHASILQSYESEIGPYASALRHKLLQPILTEAPALVNGINKIRDTGLIRVGYSMVYGTEDPRRPYVMGKRTKLFFLDIGLLQAFCPVDAEKLAEQFVWQELVATASSAVYVWDQPDSDEADIDFFTTLDAQILPIRVKPDREGSPYYIKNFMDKQSDRNIGLKIGDHELAMRDGILYLPFYMTDSCC